MAITLYTAEVCPYCVRTRLVLAGKRIPYETVEVDLRNRPPRLRELNPRNRVPVLVDGGLTLAESEAIDEYLDETHPVPAMMPAGAAGRADVRALMRRFEDLSDAYYAIRRGEVAAVDDLVAELRTLDARLSADGYVAGPSYTLADPGYWPWIARLSRVGVEPREYPGIAAWLDRLAERPEYAAELALI